MRGPIIEAGYQPFKRRRSGRGPRRPVTGHMDSRLPPLQDAFGTAGAEQMGISAIHAELIIREHKFRPLPKTVHLLGRQTVQLDYRQMSAMLDRHGIAPAAVAIEIDRTTSLAIASGQEFISDVTFFGLLGVTKIRAIDHSDFEGADIILDLNQPISADLAAAAEFVYGGSVLDNVFDPATYIKNIARLLAPGGRLLDQNLGSFHFHPYLITAPAWYFDFFVLNGFDDCKVYFIQAGNVPHLYGLEFAPDDPFISDFGSAGIGTPFGIAIIAEKGGQSTWDRVPSQDQYRDAVEWAAYRANLVRVKGAARRYEIFGCPSAMDLARAPLRWSKSFRYLGAMKAANDQSFDGTIPRASVNGLKILEASYGLNLLGQTLSRPGIVPLCAGNATEKLAELLNGQNGARLTIDVAMLGDPAPDLAKELVVYYLYLEDPAKTVREIRIAGEAHGRLLRIPPFR
jgi:SAM-dependent methyltransferase